MPRYIDADLAIKAMEEIRNDDIALYGCAIPECFDAETAIEAIDSIPTATVRENVTGKWINETFKPWGLVYHPYKCDQCGDYSEADSNYCPHCGARMVNVVGEEEECRS